MNQIAKARGLAGDVEGTLNSWAGKGKLTSTQQQQLSQILDDVKARLLEKQAIAKNALDTINNGTKREDIVGADTKARQALSDFEKYSHYVGQQVTLKNGQTVTVKGVDDKGFDY